MSDPGLAWLAAAFAISWLIIGAYLVRLSRAQRDIDRKLEQLAHPSPHTEPGDFGVAPTDLS